MILSRVLRNLASFKKEGTVSVPPKVFYQMIADTQKYSEFIPWLNTSKVVKRINDKENETELGVDFKLFKQSFVSKVKMQEDDDHYQVHSRSEDDPLKYLDSRWTITKAGENQSKVTYNLDYEFNSLSYKMASGVLEDFMGIQMWDLFVKRAQQLNHNENNESNESNERNTSNENNEGNKTSKSNEGNEGYKSQKSDNSDSSVKQGQNLKSGESSQGHQTQGFFDYLKNNAAVKAIYQKSEQAKQKLEQAWKNYSKGGDSHEKMNDFMNKYNKESNEKNQNTSGDQKRQFSGDNNLGKDHGELEKWLKGNPTINSMYATSEQAKNLIEETWRDFSDKGNLRDKMNEVVDKINQSIGGKSEDSNRSTESHRQQTQNQGYHKQNQTYLKNGQGQTTRTNQDHNAWRNQNASQTNKQKFSTYNKGGDEQNKGQDSQNKGQAQRQNQHDEKGDEQFKGKQGQKQGENNGQGSLTPDVRQEGSEKKNQEGSNKRYFSTYDKKGDQPDKPQGTQNQGFNKGQQRSSQSDEKGDQQRQNQHDEKGDEQTKGQQRRNQGDGKDQKQSNSTKRQS